MGQKKSLVNAPRKKQRIRTNWQQRNTMEYLRPLLAERGYWTFPVATWYRRHFLDRVVIKRDNPNCFLIIRATAFGTVEFCPYDTPRLFPDIHTLIVKTKDVVPARVQLRKRQLPKVRGIGKVWSVYLPKNAQKEFGQLTAHMHVRPRPGIRY